MKFAAVLLKDGEGRYIAICNYLPDCRAQGTSADEALQQLRREVVDWFAPALRISEEVVQFSLDNRTSQGSARP